MRCVLAFSSLKKDVCSQSDVGAVRASPRGNANGSSSRHIVRASNLISNLHGKEDRRIRGGQGQCHNVQNVVRIACPGFPQFGSFWSLADWAYE